MRKQLVVSVLVLVATISALMLATTRIAMIEAPSAEEKEVEVVASVAPSTPSPTPSSPSTPSPTPMPAPTPAIPSSPPPTPAEYVATDGQEYAYVPGLGYIPSGGESQITSVPGMVENGNKIGSMG